MKRVGDAACMDFAPPSWHVLWTRSGCERLASDHLEAKGFEMFLPEREHWTRRGSLRCVSRTPMFPGYVFLRHAVDRWTHLEVSRAPGVVKILGERWDRPATVPEREINAVRQVNQAGLPCISHPYVRTGRRVRVKRGPLANVEGFLVRTTRTSGLLVLSVDLLRQSLAVQIDCRVAEPT